MEGEDPAGREGVAGTGRAFDVVGGEGEGGLPGASGGAGGEGAFDGVDGDAAADVFGEEPVGGGGQGGAVQGAVGAAEGLAAELPGFDFVEDEVVDPGEGAAGAGDEVGVGDADHIDHGDEADSLGGFEEVGGGAAAVGGGGVEGVEEHQVAQVKEAGGAGVEVDVAGGEVGIGAAVVEESAAAGVDGGEGVGVAGGEVGADVELGGIDAVEAAIVKNGGGGGVLAEQSGGLEREGGAKAGEVDEEIVGAAAVAGLLRVDRGEHFLGGPGVDEFDVIDDEIACGQHSRAEGGRFGRGHGETVAGRGRVCKEWNGPGGGARLLAFGGGFGAGEAGAALGEFDVELLWGGGLAVLAGAAEPVAEGFGGLAFGFVGFEVRSDGGGDVGEGDDLLFEAGEAVARDAAADEHGVFIGGAADEAEVGVVGAAAAVGAAGHADEDGVLFEAEFAEDEVELVEDAGEGAFGFAEAEAAGGQGDAGVGDAASGGHAVGVRDAVFGENGVDGRLKGRGDLGDDDVGVRGDDEGEAEVAGDFVKSAEVLGAVGAVGDAAHADVDGAEEEAIALGVPAEVVFDGGEVEGFGGGGGDAGEAAEDFGAEAVDAHGLHGILHAGVFALGAVAVVALGGDDSFGGVDDVLSGDVEEGLGEEGPGGELAVAHAEAAADGEGVA